MSGRSGGFLLWVLLPLSLWLTGCPQMLSKDDIEVVEDRIPPTVEIVAPQDSEEYQAQISISAVIHDSSLKEADGKGEIASILFQIDNTSITAEWGEGGATEGVSYDPVSGVFELTVDTSDLTARTIVLRVTATDGNSNKTVQTRNMTRTEGPFFSDFHISDPLGASSFTVLEPLAVSGKLTNSFNDQVGTDNVTALSWRRGSWSGEIDFTVEPDGEGWRTVENVGTGGTGSRGFFRYNANDGTVEITIPRISGVDSSDRLEFLFEAEDRNGIEASYVYGVFGLEAPAGDVVILEEGYYFSSAAGSAFEVMVEAFSQAEADRISTITYW
ncbi:MAG: hypothetical protein ACOC47_10520, partial [Alkalispirochaetaceae bacterium]